MEIKLNREMLSQILEKEVIEKLERLDQIEKQLCECEKETIDKIINSEFKIYGYCGEKHKKEKIKMTREECEKQIIEKMKEIKDIYKKYNENGDFLSLAIYADKECYTVNNIYWGKDKNYPIDAAEHNGRVISYEEDSK